MWITNKPEGVRLCEKLGLAERLIPTNAQFRKSLVLRNGRAHSVPEGFQLMVPEQAWPMLRSPLLSWRGKLRLMAECLVPSRRDGADESLADFVCRRCGREAFERLVQPLVGGIYTADPEKLSLLATLPRFIEMEQQHGSLIRGAWRQSRRKSTGTSGARYGLFVSLPNGIEELVSALSRRVAEFADIRCRVKVRSVRSAKETRSVSEGRSTLNADSRIHLADASGWSVESDKVDHFDSVILAVPSYIAASLLAEGCSALSTELNRIEYASTVVVASGHKLADIDHPLDAFGLVVPHIERRQVLAVSFTSRKFPGRAPDGRVLIRTFVGGALQPELCELDDSKILQLVRRELHDLLGVRGEADFAIPFRHTRAMPQYHVGHLELVSQIRAAIAKCPGLSLAGNYLSGVGIPDSIASGEAAAEQAMH
jgi:oxygen-dependent protoporphyrinogen oxidase